MHLWFQLEDSLHTTGDSGGMDSTDVPVCVVKRFRKHAPAAPHTPPVSAADNDSTAGSFELVTGDSGFSAASPGLCRDLDAVSQISPIDLFGAESVADDNFQPRWTHLGGYDFNYQPGGSTDPFATASRRSSCFGASGASPWLQPQRTPRKFASPDFDCLATSWKPPKPVLKSRVSLQPAVVPLPHRRELAMPTVSTSRLMCADMPVVRTPLHDRGQQGPSQSMQQAWSAAKSALDQQWLDVLLAMGSCSGLVTATESSRHVVDHRLRVISKFAPSTLQSYFRIWQRWQDFAKELGACPFQPDHVFLADFLAEHAHGPLGVATAYHKGLSWVARHAQLPDLFQALQSSVCKAHLQSSVISEKRESAPLPLSFVVYLEKMILAKDASNCDILQLGALLFLIWSSLRWSDALWVDPKSISIQQHALFAISSHTKTTNRGMPIACYAFGLLGQHGNASWAQTWLNVIQQAIHDTQHLYPAFAVDFLLTEVGTDLNRPLFLRPMPRDRGLQLLRYWLCKCHEAHGVVAKPEDFHLLGTHSCKTTLLCWSQQLQLSLEQRQLQGHHRSAVNGSVALYSRNDTLPALMLQCTVAQRIAEGFRPLRPMLRGGSPSLPDFSIQLPSWKPLAFQVEPKSDVQESVPAPPPEPVEPEAPQDDDGSEASEASAVSEVMDEPSALAPEELIFLVNPVTKVAHLAIQCSSSDRAMCYEDSNLQPYRTGCGARPNAISGDLQFTHCLPEGARFCLRRACARIMSQVI